MFYSAYCQPTGWLTDNSPHLPVNLSTFQSTLKRNLTLNLGISKLLTTDPICNTADCVHRYIFISTLTSSSQEQVGVRPTSNSRDIISQRSEHDTYQSSNASSGIRAYRYDPDVAISSEIRLIFLRISIVS